MPRAVLQFSDSLQTCLSACSLASFKRLIYKNAPLVALVYQDGRFQCSRHLPTKLSCKALVLIMHASKKSHQRQLLFDKRSHLSLFLALLPSARSFYPFSLFFSIYQFPLFSPPLSSSIPDVHSLYLFVFLSFLP